MSIIQTTGFDYSHLDPETRIVVRQKTDELKTLLRAAAQNIFDIGARLTEVRDQLRHNREGGFEGWLSAEFGMSPRTAYRFINVFEQFSNSANLAELDIAASALYLLAAPSTPDDARQEALRRAEAGERITHHTAQQLVKGSEPEPTEADIAIARDLVAEALGAWARPTNRGSIYNQVQRLDGGAHTTRKAVYLALDRMIEAGNVLDLKDEHGRRVHALAHDPVSQPASADEATSPVVAELDAKFDRSKIIILGRTDDGAEHRAVDVARKLVAAGLWDGQSKIEFDAYELHDKLFGVAPISPLDLVEGQDTLFFPGRPRDLENRILGLLTASPLPAAIVCERLHMADTAVKRRAVHLALDDLRRDRRVREYRGMWFIEREHTGTAQASPDESAPAPASDRLLPQRVLDTLSVRPMYIYELRSRVGGTAGGYDLRALLTRLEAEGKVSHTGDLYQIVKAAQPAAPEPDEREEVPEGSAEWLAGMADNCTGDYDYEPDPADQKLPTPTAQDASKVRDLLKQHAPMPLRMKYIREQLDMGDGDFYRARMLLMGGGEVAQDGDSLRLAVKPATPPKSLAGRIGTTDTMQDEPNGSGMAVHYSSESAEWYTPAAIVERVIQALTGIDLDPCSNSQEAPNVPAAMHYTKADDGLTREWHGKAFLNPPYGREIAQWVEKLVAEHQAGRVTQAIALLPARTDTAWFSALRDFPRCFLQGRLKFLTPQGVEMDPAPFPSALVYLGPDTDRFAEVFADLGDVYVRYQAPKEEGGVPV